VIADTVKSGYNALLNRDLSSDEDAPNDATNNQLKQFFPNPKSASNWVTNVLGDQVITTCNDDNCKSKQGSLVGRGLLPWVTSCQANKNDCSATIRAKFLRMELQSALMSFHLSARWMLLNKKLSSIS
jgi:hypothetical protein